MRKRVVVVGLCVCVCVYLCVSFTVLVASTVEFICPNVVLTE